MTRMHNPPHPGEVLREYLGDRTVAEAAVKLGVNRVNLSRVVTVCLAHRQQRSVARVPVTRSMRR